jgi:hypothetical protein
MAQQRRQRTRDFPAEAPPPIVNIAERRSQRDALQPNRKTGVFLAVPSESGQVNFSIAMLFGRALVSSQALECPYQFTIHMEIGKRGIDYARNCIVKTFLEESDADWLIMIDDDQVVPENFWQLCTVKDADVVSALTPVWVGNMDPEAMLRVNNYGVDAQHHCYNLQMPGDEIKQPYRVPIVGTGAIAIRRRVFSPRPHGIGDAPFYFTHEDNRKVRGGEDVNFSVECNRAGFVLAVHPGVWFDHMKTLALMQVEKYYRARKAMELAGKQTTDAQRISIG